MFYLGVDPGKDKCGLALLDEDRQVISQRIVLAKDLEEEILHLVKRDRNVIIIIGDGTTSKRYIQLLKKNNLEVKVVKESYSTLEAKDLYFKENGYGWQIILPKGLRSPRRPIDDYAARVLVDRYLEEK